MRTYIIYTDQPICFSSKTKLYNYLFKNYARNIFPGTDHLQLRTENGIFKNIKSKSSFNEFMVKNRNIKIFVIPPLNWSDGYPIIYTCDIS